MGRHFVTETDGTVTVFYLPGCEIVQQTVYAETKKGRRLPNMTTANKTIKINDVEAAKKLVSAAVRCPFDIDIVSKGKIFIDAKSILGVLSLGVEEPLELKYEGYDEDFESVVAGLAC
jgi:phosphocarrier protein HPr